MPRDGQPGEAVVRTTEGEVLLQWSLDSATKLWSNGKTRTYDLNVESARKEAERVLGSRVAAALDEQVLATPRFRDAVSREVQVMASEMPELLSDATAAASVAQTINEIHSAMSAGTPEGEEARIVLAVTKALERYVEGRVMSASKRHSPHTKSRAQVEEAVEEAKARQLKINDRRASAQSAREQTIEEEKEEESRDIGQEQDRSEKGSMVTSDRRAGRGEGVRKPWERPADDGPADVIPLEQPEKTRTMPTWAKAAVILTAAVPVGVLFDVATAEAAYGWASRAVSPAMFDFAAFMSPVLRALMIIGLLVPLATHEVRMKFNRTYRNEQIRKGLNNWDLASVLSAGRSADTAAEELLPVVLAPVRSLRRPGLKADYRSPTDIGTSADGRTVFAKLAPLFHKMKGIGALRMPKKVYAVGQGLMDIARNPLGVFGHTHPVEGGPGLPREEALRQLVESLSLQDVVTTLQTESMMGFIATPDGLHRIYYEVFNDGKDGLKVKIHDQERQIAEKSWAELVAKAVQKNDMIHLTIQHPRTKEPALIEVPSDALMLMAYFEPKNLAAFFGASSPEEVEEFLGKVSKRTRANPAVQRMLDGPPGGPGGGAGLIAAYMPRYIGTVVTMSPSGGAAAASGAAVSGTSGAHMSAGLGASVSMGIRQGLERLGVQPPSSGAGNRSPEEAGEFVAPSVLVADADPAAPRDVWVSIINLLMFSKDSGHHLRVLILADQLNPVQRLRLRASIYLRADTRAAYRQGRILLADKGSLAGVLKEGKIDFAGLVWRTIPQMFNLKNNVSLGILADENRFIVGQEHRELFKKLLLDILPGMPLAVEKLFHSLIAETRAVDLSA
jgi:hypothetical protein